MKKRKHTFCIFDQEKNFEGKKSEERKFLSATKLNKQTNNPVAQNLHSFFTFGSLYTICT